MSDADTSNADESDETNENHVENQNQTETEKKAETEMEKRELKEKKKLKEKRKKKLKKRQDEIEKIKNIIDNFQSQKIPFSDSFSSVKQMLGENPEKISLQTDESQKKAIQRMEDELKKCVNYLKVEEVTPTQVIEKSSAVRGTFCTKDLDDWIQSRRQMVNIGKNVKFRTPTLTQKQNTVEHNSQLSFTSFNKAVEKSGWGLAVGLKAYQPKAGVGVGYERNSEEEKTTQLHSSLYTSYYCKATYVVVPVALWAASLSDVSLSKDIVEELKQVENLIALKKNDLVKEKVLEIFKTYGSHLYCGDIHFGGLFQIKTEYQTEKESMKSEVEEIVNTTHRGHANACLNLFGVVQIGGGASMHTENTVGEIKGNFSSSQLSNVNMSLTKLGGPIEIDSVDLWKKGLVENNSSWVVVDGGKPIRTGDSLDPKDFEGIWNLVQNQSSLFTDSIALSNVLLETWHAVSGLQLSESMVQVYNIFWQKTKIDELIAQNAEKELTPLSYVTFFDNLSALVYKTETTTGLHLLWREELKTNGQLRSLFESLPSIQFKGIDAIKIRETVQKLLNMARDVSFPQKAAVLNWLKENKIPNTAKLLRGETIGTIERLFEALRMVAPYPNITGDVGTVIKQLSEKLRIEQNVLEYMIFVSFVILLDFDVQEGRFRAKLDFDKIYTCIDKTMKVQESLLKLKNKQSSEAVLQAHCLQRIIESLKSTTINDLPTTRNTLVKSRFKETKKDILEHFSYALDSEINTAIDQVDANEIFKNLEIIANRQGPSSRLSHLAWTYFEDFSRDSIPNVDTKKIKSLDDHDDGKVGTDNRNMKDILDIFGLVKYFPAKISVQMALSIQDDVNTNTKGPNIPWIILKKIIAANSDFREKVLKEFWNKTIKTTSSPGDLLADLSSSDEDEAVQRDAFHPSDVFLAIFQCCDPFLKRLIITKISFCQFAVPIVFTNYLREDLVFSTWPINDVVLHGETETLMTKERQTVSFIRVGNGSVPSKSKLINEFLRDINEEHATFIHKDCPLGMHHRTVSTGMVEMSWLIPEQHNSSDQLNANETSSIRAPINIFNLRGDAQDLDNQLNILLLLSNVMVIIISCDDLKQKKLNRILQTIQSSNISVIVLTDMTGSTTDKQFLKRYIREMDINLLKTRVLSTLAKQKDDSIDSIRRSSSDLKETITSTIVDLLRVIPTGVQIEQIKTNLPAGIRSDESQKCVLGKELADSLLKKCMHNGQHEQRKDTFLPLQGNRLWHEISKKEKDLKRSKSDVYDNEEKILRNIRELRRKQTLSCNEAPNAFSIFVEILLKYTADKEVLQYFIFWFKQMLNNESRVLLKELLQKFFTAFKDHESTKETQESGSKSQENLDKAEERLAEASFGIEHFFREIGQVYEAFMHTSEDLNYSLTETTVNVLNKLPYVVANLLLLGHSFEIMDGDAANVPQKWVASVLKEVQNIVGSEKKVITVSVLGIQSSGKSTLLNTMFGLEFSVSAGRCTRGIYIQLVPVKNSKNIHADYMIVLDTEGLRAPERAGEKVHHDNEIATLVVGLADVVLLNLKGESISDMTNILEIVITGLLRLQQVNKSLTLSQSCIFVHQNVSKDAQLMMLQGNRNIVKHLDIMTRDVAIQEKIADTKHFADVIKFNPTEDVRYVPDLFHGSPGMAPVNQNYSTEVISIHKCIFREKAPKIHPLTIENYLLHLQSLWQGIQAEDFIFSFRSILEIKSYSLLESEYQSLIWELEEWKLEWMHNNIKPRLQCCKDVASITECAKIMIKECQYEMDARYEKSDKSLAEFVKTSELQEHMQHYIVEKRNNMKFKKNYLERDTQQRIKEEQAKCTSKLSSEDILTTKEKQITNSARKLAKGISGTKPSRDVMNEEFEKLWTKFSSDLATDFPQKTTKEKTDIIKDEIESTLNDLYATHGALLRSGLKEFPIDKGLYSDLLTEDMSKFRLEESMISYLFRKIKRAFVKGDVPVKAQNVIKEIFIDIDHEFDSLLRKETEYNQSQFSGIMKKIKTKLLALNESNRNVTLSPEQEISVALHVARHSFYQFQKMNSNYERKHGLQARLESKKPIVHQMFINICERQAEELIATKALCAELKTSIEEKLERELIQLMYREIVKKFNLQKHHLMKSIMEDLATDADFDNFMTYICNSETYVQRWLKMITDREIFQKKNNSEHSSYTNWLEITVSDIIEKIKNSAVETTQESNTDMSEWIKCFQKQIECQNLALILEYGSIELLCCHDTMDFEGFLKSIIANLSELETVLINTWKEKTPSDFVLPESPYDMIYTFLWGCTYRCPWCHEPCQKSDRTHESNTDCHNCIQHRPTGVNGMHNKSSEKLAIESCNYDVQSITSIHCGSWCECPDKDCKVYHPAREYKTYMKNWDIQPLADMSNSKYWNWFMQTYSKQLADYYGVKQPTIPASWKSLTKKDAIQSLSEVYVIS